MALCIRIDPTREGIVRGFALNDLLLKALARREAAHCTDGASEDLCAIGCRDDYFTAPYGLVVQRMRKRKNQLAPQTFHYMIFTAYKCRQAHDDCIAEIKQSDVMVALGGLHDVHDGALDMGSRVKPDVHAFRLSVYAGGDDVCTKLEDAVFTRTAEKIGVDARLDGWRAERTAKLCNREYPQGCRQSAAGRRERRSAHARRAHYSIPRRSLARPRASS